MKIVAGIVLYNPDIERLKENINSIINQVQKIYLFDNGSMNIESINELLSAMNENCITLINSSENTGIAHALNILCKRAQRERYSWILTLDQDSVCPSNMIECYSRALATDKLAMLCPRLIDRNTNLDAREQLENHEVEECITSGSLLRIKAWEIVGGFDERMFIDGVDFDICHRLKKCEYYIICISKVVLLHELGHIKVKNFLFWKINIKNHSSFRKYYIARNTIYLARKEKRNLVKPILQNIKFALLCLMYEEDKFEKVQRVTSGTYDGITMDI